MKKLENSKNIIFSQLLNDYSKPIKQEPVKTYPKMPNRQIKHYVKIAHRNKKIIYIQLQPSNSKKCIEISGKITFFDGQNQLILSSVNKKIFHLVQSNNIHHLRLSK